MALDPYQPCPCGSGKKIKFCCADLAGELEKLQRMLAAEQYAACLDRVEQLQAKYPGRPSLFTYKIAVQSALGQREAVARTVQDFAAQHPGNPLVLAEQAVLRAEAGALAEAVGLLQQAVETGIDPLPGAVVGAFGAVGDWLAARGYVVAAIKHLSTELSLCDEASEALGSRRLAELVAAPQLSPYLRQTFVLTAESRAQPVSAEHQAALEQSHKLLWRRAAASLAALAERAPQDAQVWRDLAIVRGWLADQPGAAEAWRHVAALPAPLERAVEAEALAQILSGEFAAETVELLKIEFPLPEFGEVETRLSANPRFRRLELDTSAWDPEHGPPPRALVLIFDQPLSASGTELTLEALQTPLGEALLFPRQTDREARLELTVRRPAATAAREMLGQALGDLLGPPGAEQTVGRLSVIEDLLAQRPLFPEDTPVDLEEDLGFAWLQRLVFERLPEMPLGLLGGRTLREAAADPAAQTKALALLSEVRAALDHLAGHWDLDQLSNELGLPPLPRIVVDRTGFDSLELPDYLRLDFDALPESLLPVVFARSVVMGMPEAAMRAARRLVTVDQGAVRADAYAYLARSEPRSRQVLVYLERAQQASAQAGESCVRWDVMELSLRLRRHEAQKFLDVLRHIEQAHGREPGVMQMVARALVQLGILQPDGTLAIPEGDQDQTPGLVAGAASAETGSKLWTPSSDQPRREKVSLWTPGS